MSKKEIILQELDSISEEDFDALLGFVESLKRRHSDDGPSALMAESSLMKDWLSPEEEEAWADLERVISLS